MYLSSMVTSVAQFQNAERTRPTQWRTERGGGGELPRAALPSGAAHPKGGRIK